MRNRHKSRNHVEHIADIRSAHFNYTKKNLKKNLNEMNMRTFSHQYGTEETYHFFNTVSAHELFLSQNIMNFHMGRGNVSIYLMMILLLTYNQTVLAEELTAQTQQAEQMTKVCKDDICKNNNLLPDAMNANRFFSSSAQKNESTGKSKINITHFLKQIVTIRNKFKEETISQENSISNEYKKYYAAGKKFYEDKIKKILQTIFEETFYKEMMTDFSEFTIEPTGCKKKLRNSDAFTLFVKKIIFLDIKKIYENETELKPLLMNELQHLFIIRANEKRYNKKLDNETDARKFKDPFQNKAEKKAYLEAANTALQQFVQQVNVLSYIQSDAFRIYLQQVAGYELTPCKNLREGMVNNKYVTNAMLTYRNGYVLDKKLNPEDQIYELDTSIASLYSLLSKEDKKHFNPWVKYHQDYMRGNYLEPQPSQTAGSPRQKRN